MSNDTARSPRRGWWIAGAIVLVAAVAVVVYLAVASEDPMTEPTGDTSAEPMDESPTDEPMTDEPMTDEPMTDEPMTDEPMTDAAQGVYRDYAEAAVSEVGYDRTILFFHAQWCPECRAFEAALTEADIPDGIQILKVDYDTAEELKRQHEVTIQTTFVEVDDNGAQLGSWVGYEQDRSVDAILAGLGQ